MPKIANYRVLSLKFNGGHHHLLIQSPETFFVPWLLCDSGAGSLRAYGASYINKALATSQNMLNVNHRAILIREV